MKDVFQEYGILMIKIVSLLSLITMIAAATYNIELWAQEKTFLWVEAMFNSMIKSLH